jgi:hypothetical protein
MGLFWLCFGAQLSACFKWQRNDCNAPNTIIEWCDGDNRIKRPPAPDAALVQ